ncbi:type II toxin-antitoxin system HipA family toxin [Vibrio cholerae]|uniref:type II toxin-antitoxin system HipA family toxin n=1 Tax=Vibrio TaxID=662 RepID=UPI000C222BF9|nr:MULTISPECIES: type II toxin-antitoxin system HipA family toxin [Vibrio]EGR0489724.1 type II toxin-antitoxin system HipA family toxin [Vibrio cholerae]EGR0521941.1 type II toxin-antitoxin system HipA family toxin [Vibrio cholerae]EGR4406478.1 type II toxin-antitoxin system HipA family toxin [Vibrio cholerae]EKO3488767.1 type II toxin-antitoxin system HipA family toxin [Vibrio fluvialis]ELK1826431.1 type II toxin-antitoxin system HipA family toxin [Vibrio cholerae]
MPSLIAHINNTKIGHLTKTTDGSMQFCYDDNWLDKPNAYPISLSLPLQSQPHKGDPVANYFDNLLPDLTSTRKNIQCRHSTASTNTFDLLHAIGRDCVGSLSLLPENEVQNGLASTRLEPLSVRNLHNIFTAHEYQVPLGMIDKHDFRITISGAQEKTALLNIKDEWFLPSLDYPSTHILKFPIGFIQQPTATLDMTDSVENEYFCIKLAEAMAFQAPKIEILEVEGMKTLAIERFDRHWSKDENALIRLSQEDMCQVFSLPSRLKYQSDSGVGIKEIMQLLSGSRCADKDCDDFMRFQVFQWLVGATDGHAKNFSIFIEADSTYRLTPFYDIMSAFPASNGKGINTRKLKLAMSLKSTSSGNKWHLEKIYPRHFIATAETVGFCTIRMQEILDEFVDTFPNAIEQVVNQLPNGFPAQIIDSIVSNSLRILGKITL